MVQRDVDDGEQVGREHRGAGVMDPEVRRDEDAATESIEVPAQAVLDLADGAAVLGALGRGRFEVGGELFVEIRVNGVEGLGRQPRRLVEGRAALEPGDRVPKQGERAGGSTCHRIEDRAPGGSDGTEKAKKVLAGLLAGR